MRLLERAPAVASGFLIALLFIEERLERVSDLVFIVQYLSHNICRPGRIRN